jgi:hypothetical protein
MNSSTKLRKIFQWAFNLLTYMHLTHQDPIAPIWIDLIQRNGTSWFWDSINQEPKYTHWYKEGEPSNNNKTEGEPGNRVLMNIESPLSSR